MNRPACFTLFHRLHRLPAANRCLFALLTLARYLERMIACANELYLCTRSPLTLFENLFNLRPNKTQPTASDNSGEQQRTFSSLRSLCKHLQVNPLRVEVGSVREL